MPNFWYRTTDKSAKSISAASAIFLLFLRIKNWLNQSLHVAEKLRSDDNSLSFSPFSILSLIEGYINAEVF